jgi:hypothetical protein
VSLPPILFFHDSRHPLLYMYEPPMQPEELESAVDELLGTPVGGLMYCLGDGRTMLHDTQAGERWGDNVRRWPHLVFRRAQQNARDLIRRGHDPLRVVAARARATGMGFYPTLLVQQGRGPREVDVRCSDFRFDNTHLEIGARGNVDPDWRGATCLDFAHDEVRDERFALIDEALGYDVDGVELHLNYTPCYFHPDEVEAGRPLMTAWIERVHRAVRASGAERQLLVRVPASLDGCRRVGLAVDEWIEDGLVDAVIGQRFSGAELLDPSLDVRDLVAAAGGTACKVYAALQSHVDTDRLAEGSIEMIRAAACNLWEQGIDGLYLAHWFGRWPYGAEFYEILREVPHPGVMAPKDKIYALPTQTGRYPEPPPLEPGASMQLPQELTVGEPARVSLPVSDDLRRWGKVQRVHEVLLRLRLMATTERDRLIVRLNGKQLPEEALRVINEMYRMSAPRYRTGSGYWFVFRLDRAHWPRRGSNRIEVELTKRDGAVLPPVVLRDVELEIRYLMGRNFHRTPEEDLGPRESSGI